MEHPLRFQLGVLASSAPSLRPNPVHSGDGSLVQPPEKREARNQAASVVLQQSVARVPVQVQTLDVGK
eukprot:CAMPEP_0194555946 /NCGR_PEP_ID=MMETSP0253-20130528/98495_1 /TAXON_ID=2966 /ORGANISM="Noctiluca scintillans" /LENGTH=67 /DNA_ID=CAMNT_0039403445 /DNA_START=795 /DNA_END=998 /DNA_ORIENTATION=-